MADGGGGGGAGGEKCGWTADGGNYEAIQNRNRLLDLAGRNSK